MFSAPAERIEVDNAALISCLRSNIFSSRLRQAEILLTGQAQFRVSLSKFSLAGEVYWASVPGTTFTSCTSKTRVESAGITTLPVAGSFWSSLPRSEERRVGK